MEQERALAGDGVLKVERALRSEEQHEEWSEPFIENATKCKSEPDSWIDTLEVERFMSDWIRHGECNQCGDCCRQATNPVEVLVPLEASYGRVRFGEPVRLTMENGTPVTLFRIRGPILNPCPELRGNLCGIQASKPMACVVFPTEPLQIEGTRCSYWFEHRQTGAIKRAESPET